MNIDHVLLLILLFQGSNSIKFFLQRNLLACTFEYTDHEENHLKDKQCIFTQNKATINFDYQLIPEYINDFEGAYSRFTLKGSPFNESSQTISTFSLDYFDEPIRDFAVDWVHNRVYILMKYVKLASISRTTDPIPLTEILPNDDKLRLYFESIKVDPYKRYVFVLGQSVGSERAFIVIRSDLNGNELKNFTISPLIADSAKLCLDINEAMLYVSIKEKLHVYNYDGERVGERLLPYSVVDFTVFENTVYLTTHQANGIIVVHLNQTESPLEVTKVIRHDLSVNSDMMTIRIIDTRAKRRKEEGKYVCDRSDCPELCEVESSGDTCVCFHTKAKTSDGVMCYTCGQSNLTSLVQQPTIVDGRVSYPGDFPWHAILYKNNQTVRNEFICGGTLISLRVVLTAAHCVTSVCFACTPPVMMAEELKVALGKTNRFWNIQEPYETKHNVSEIVVRESFLGPSTNYANDIALLFLDSNVTVNSHVMPACLDYNLNQLPPYETLTGYVCGFGYTKECGRACSKHSEELLHTTGTVITTDDCLNALNEKDQSTFHSLTSDKFCMGNGTVSVVQSGDSGGGFTLSFRGLHYVTGVVSIKLLRYRAREFKYSFGGFTNISMHMDWLKKNLVDEF